MRLLDEVYDSLINRRLSSSALGIFRVLWGLAMVYECTTYLFLEPGKLASLDDSRYHFKFYGFGWVAAPSASGLIGLIYGLLACALCITFGLLFRPAAWLFFFGFSYLYLIELALYLNHFYLISLFSLLVALLPLNSSFSVDAWLFRGVQSATVPAWVYVLLRSEVAIVYFFAAWAKVNEDWLRGEPLRHWLLARAEMPLIGKLFTYDLACYLFSYFGLLYDMLMPFLMFWRLTAPLCIILSVGFHVTNKLLFNIGIFPYVMLALTTLVLDADWPLHVIPASWQSAGGTFSPAVAPPAPASAALDLRASSSDPTIVEAVRSRRIGRPTTSQPAVEEDHTARPRRPRKTLRGYLLLTLLTLFLLYNLLMPIRYMLYPGDVAWHEHGHRFSWRMKLRDKNCQGAFILFDPATNTSSRGDLTKYLNSRQVHKMWGRPEMTLQFAHFLAGKEEELGRARPRVYADVRCSLNYRTQQNLIPPVVDLAAVDIWRWPYPFVTQLQPLNDTQKADFLWRRLWDDPRSLLKRLPRKKSSRAPSAD